MKKYSKWFIVAGIATLVGVFFAYDLSQYLSFDYIKSQKQILTDIYLQNNLLVTASYFGIYVMVTAISLPGAVVLTLLGGALFGVLKGTVLVSFASTIGATCAFLVSRFLLKDYVQTKFKEKLTIINNGIQKEGGFYLFTLRLIPVFPFFLINLLMGLTPMRTSTYYLISQLGMLPGTIVYVNAGTQLSQLDSLSGITSPSLLASFAALGLLPLIFKYSISAVRKYRTKNSGV